MARQFQVFVEYDPSEKAWVTYVPALDHMSTFGPTRDEALATTREAIVGYLEAADKEGVHLTVDATITSRRVVYELRPRRSGDQLMTAESLAF